MDKSYIRIKFTPLMKCFTKLNPNYCIEIVPIVTCIKNINKLPLKTEEYSAEYIIPMTYKIIIKKQDIDCSLKIYHSCVDLLPSSSLLTFEKLNSDIPQYAFSESHILHKVTSLVNMKPINVQLNNKENINHDTLPKNKTYVKHNNYDTNDQSTSCIEDEITFEPISPNMENLENKRNPFKMQLFKNNFEDVISFRQHFVQRNSDFYLGYQQMLINIDSDYDIIFKQTLNSSTKLLPEERVALFKRTMENFVYPLKVAMNDIINKCTSLGIAHLLKKPKNDEVITNDFNNNFKKSCKNNRMVYSIIFDE